MRFFAMQLGFALGLAFCAAGISGASATEAGSSIEFEALGLDESVSATAEFITADGGRVGTAILNESANGMLVRLDLQGLPPGEHAIHIHETGDCSPVELPPQPLDPQNYFSNAGSHLNPINDTHGLMSEDGPHAGDMPNIFASQDGTVKAHIFNPRVTLRGENGDSPAEKAVLLDEDGAALVIHEGADDYESQPTGKAGHRIACAVIQPE